MITTPGPRFDRQESALGSCGCIDYHMADCHLGPNYSHYSVLLDDAPDDEDYWERGMDENDPADDPNHSHYTDTDFDTKALGITGNVNKDCSFCGDPVYGPWDESYYGDDDIDPSFTPSGFAPDGLELYVSLSSDELKVLRYLH